MITFAGCRFTSYIHVFVCFKQLVAKYILQDLVVQLWLLALFLTDSDS